MDDFPKCPQFLIDGARERDARYKAEKESRMMLREDKRVLAPADAGTSTGANGQTPPTPEAVKTKAAKPRIAKPKAAKAAKPKAEAKPAKKAAAKAKAKPAKKATTERTADPAKLDEFGLRKGSLKSKAAALYAGKKGATLKEVEEKVGSPQFNVLTQLREKGFKVLESKIAGDGGRQVTRYQVAR